MAEREKLQLIISADDKASKDLNRITKSLNGMNKASQTFAKGFMVVGAGLAAIGVGAVKLAGDLEANRIGFETLLGSAELANEAIAMVKKDAAATPFELPGLLQANQLLTSVTKDAGRSERLLLNVGKALSAMGKGQPELDRIIVNLQQIGAVGKASMLDVKQFAFAGIPIFEMLKNEFSLTGEELEDLIKTGGVTFEKLEEMFQTAGEGSGRFADAFTNMAGTFNQLVSNMKDNLGIFLAEFVEQIGLMDFLKQQLTKLIELTTILTTIDWKKWLEENRTALILIAGAIIGMLAPAVAGLLLSVGGLVLALAPLAAIGAGITLAFSLWSDQIMAVLNPALDFFINTLGNVGKIINEAIMWVNNIRETIGGFLPTIDENNFLLGFLAEQWTRIVNIFVESLLPTLQNLFETFEPFIPLIAAVAKMIGTVLVASILIGLEVTITLIEKLAWLLKVITDITAWIGQHLRPALDSMASGIGTIVNHVVSLINKLKQLKDMAAGAFGNIVSKIGGVFGGGRAEGGEVSPGRTFLVGERGPELFSPSSAGNIIPNNALGGGGSNVNVNISITDSVVDNDIIGKIGDALVQRLAGEGVSF